MARNAKITRTITTTTADILCIDTSTEQTFVETVTFGNTFKANSDILKAARKRLNSETVQAISVKNVTTDSKLYGIDEDFFLAHAEVIEK